MIPDWGRHLVADGWWMWVDGRGVGSVPIHPFGEFIMCGPISVPAGVVYHWPVMSGSGSSKVARCGVRLGGFAARTLDSDMVTCGECCRLVEEGARQCKDAIPPEEQA